MSIRQQIIKARYLAGVLRKDVMAQAVELEDPATGQVYAFQAVVAGMTERGANAEGGFALEHDSQARWLRADGPDPELGWLFRRKSGGRVYRIDEVMDHGNSAEWKVGLGDARS